MEPAANNDCPQESCSSHSASASDDDAPAAGRASLDGSLDDSSDSTAKTPRQRLLAHVKRAEVMMQQACSNTSAPHRDFAKHQVGGAAGLQLSDATESQLSGAASSLLIDATAPQFCASQLDNATGVLPFHFEGSSSGDETADDADIERLRRQLSTALQLDVLAMEPDGAVTTESLLQDMDKALEGLRSWREQQVTVLNDQQVTALHQQQPPPLPDLSEGPVGMYDAEEAVLNCEEWASKWQQQQMSSLQAVQRLHGALQAASSANAKGPLTTFIQFGVHQDGDTYHQDLMGNNTPQAEAANLLCHAAQEQPIEHAIHGAPTSTANDRQQSADHLPLWEHAVLHMDALELAGQLNGFTSQLDSILMRLDQVDAASAKPLQEVQYEDVQ